MHICIIGTGMKIRTTLLLDKEKVEKAKEVGINLSKATEYALFHMIEALETVGFPSGPGGI